MSNSLIDISKFPVDWLRTRNGFIPSNPRATEFGKLRRDLLTTGLPADRIPFVNYNNLNSHERWLAVVSQWIKNIRTIHARLNKEHHPQISKNLTRMRACLPVGYRGQVRKNNIGAACDNRLCLFCHARRGPVFFQRLRHGMRVAPPGSRLKLVYLSGTCTRAQLNKRVLSRKVAGATGFSYPVATADNGKVLWGYKLVAITDRFDKCKGLPMMKLTGEGGLLVAIRKWLTYPREWSSKPVRGADRLLWRALQLDATLTGSPKSVVHYGACLGGHSSTRSAMGFKLTRLQVDLLLNGKGEQCQPNRSSGSAGTPCSTSPLPPQQGSDPPPKTRQPPS